MNVEGQKCPKCGYKIGTPLDKTGQSFELQKTAALCFCVRCLAVVWLSADQPPAICDNRDFFSICLLRPNEMLRMMEVTLLLNKQLPLIDAEKN